MKSKVKISKVNTPEGEDVNSLVQSHEPEILNHLIKERTFLFSSDPRSDKEEKSETKTDRIQNQRNYLVLRQMITINCIGN